MKPSVHRLRRLLVCLSLVVTVASAAAVAAQAQTVVSHDGSGRPITFDVLASEVDVDWYASLLRSAPHGNEISAVTIRIVPAAQVESYCGQGAAACYGGRVITVPAGRDVETAHDLLHEYGHHLDSFWPVAGVRELNGTSVWWTARGIAALLAQGSVTWDYSLGWSHSIGEIFAEDYAYILLGDSYGIPWLSPPDAALKSALLAELGATSTPSPSVTPSPSTTPRPVVVYRRGFLAAGQRRSLPFRLLGPGRHVTFTATVGGSSLPGTRVRLEVVCNGTRLGSEVLAQGRRTATVDLGSLGPASCEAALASTTSRGLSYSAQLRLALDSR